RGEDTGSGELRIQYKDYAAWQQEQLKGEEQAAHRRYWLQQLGGDLPVLELTGDRPRPVVKTYRGGTVSCRFGQEETERLREIVRQQGGTLFMGLLAGVNALLHRYTGQEDLIVGSQTAGRNHIDLEDQLGIYVNTLALRTRLKGEWSYRELLEEVKRVTMEAYEHQDYPFDELVQQLQPERDRSRNPLFDVSVVLQNVEGVEVEGEGRWEGMKARQYADWEDGTSKFDWGFTFIEQGKGLDVSLTYNGDVYLLSTAERMLDHWMRLQRALLPDPGLAIGEADYLSPEEEKALLAGFNTTAADYPRDSTLVDLLHEQAE